MKTKAIMLVGTNSGCGKTTITCAVLRALMNSGLEVAAFKCGPDYIDPMFHSKVIGVPSRNMDFFLCGENYAKELFLGNCAKADIAIIEGVMGFYDGMGGVSVENSSCHIGNSLNVPSVLIVDCRGASLSMVALVNGYKNFMPNTICGLILNNVSKAMYLVYKQMLESQTGLRVIGHMPHEPLVTLESRHLGLVTANEVQNLSDKIEKLATIAAETIDLELLLSLAMEISAVDKVPYAMDKTVKIAIAQDDAFCFYYKDSLDLLESMGVKLIPFSPLKDSSLPKSVSGMIIGGGYPELYVDELSKNSKMLCSIKSAANRGMPIFAECGGFMYLGNKIENKAVCGVIPMESKMTKRLQNFGYTKLTALSDNMLMKKGECIHAHEFHYSDSTLETGDLQAQKASGKTWKSGYCRGNIFAMYPHIHMGEKMAKQFIIECEKYIGGEV